MRLKQNLLLIFGIVIAILCSTMVSYAEAKDTTSLTTKEVYKDVKSAMAQIAKGLSTTAEHVYQVLVKQAIVEAIICSVLLIVGFFFLYFTYKGAIDSTEEWSTKYDTPTRMVIVRIVQGCIGLFLFMYGICNIDIIITGFVNPEYAAIKQILSIVKSI